MNEEEKFDELLNSKLSERDFPFDELNWDEAERLIIQQESRRKITRFALIFSGGLIAGILIMLPFILNTHNVLPNTIATKGLNQSPVAQNNTSSATNQSQLNTTIITGKEEKAPLPVQSAFVKKETRTGTRGISSNSNVSSIAKTTKEHKSILLADINKPQHHHKIRSTQNLIAFTGEPNSNPIDTKIANQKDVSSNQEHVTNASSAMPANTTVADNNNSSISTAVISPATAKVSDNAASTNKNSTSQKNNTSNKTNLIATIATTPSGNNSAPPTTKIKKDSNNISPPLLPVPIELNDHSKNIFSVYAGGNYALGWKGISDGNEEGKGLTPWVGFNFTHYFASDISASIGIGYAELNKLNQPYTSISTTGYDFGANESVTTIAPQTAYYVAFPLNLQYSIDKNDMFGLGLNYQLLLTTYCILTTYQQTYFSQTSATSEKQVGVDPALSTSDLQLTLSYTRMITGRLGVSIEYYRDLGSIEPGIPTAKNNGIRLIFSY